MKIGNKEISSKVTCSIAAIAVVAIMFVPVLYSFIYLKAFWDPYGNLDKVPVAFVNLDKPVTMDNKEYHIGKDVEDNLREGKKFKWDFVSYDEGKKGVEDSKYYAMIVIPEDFSQKMANAQEGKFEKGEIIYVPNKGTNFIFSQISSKAADAIKNEVESKFAEETTKESVQGTYDIKTKISDANDGASKLVDGGQQLKEGSSQLVNGIAQAGDGTKQLVNGQTELASKMPQLVDGASQVNNGLAQLNNKIPGLADGASQVSKGISGLSDNMPQLVDGAAQVSSGVVAIKSAISPQFANELSSAADGVQQVNDAVDIANNLITAVQQDIANGSFTDADKAELTQIQGILGSIKQNSIGTNIADPLKTAATSLQPQLGLLDQLSAGAASVSGGVQQASQVIGKLKDGASAVSGGVNQTEDAVNKLFNGQTQVVGGVSKTSSAVGQLKDGAEKLSGGLGQLSTGAAALNNGLNDENNGLSTLKDGLNTGYNDISNKLKFTADDMGKYVSEPVVVNEKPINNVQYYGEGLAPYFIALSLWLGAMFVNVIVTITRFAEIVKNKFLRSYTGKVLTGSALVSIQAIILSFALVKGLGLSSVNTSYFYLNNIFISIVFYSVMFGLSYAIGGMATPIAFVAFILQLASCAGTFPIETAPAIYGTIGKWVPITYSVKLIRMITSGINNDLFKENMAIMVTFLIVFLGAGFIVGTIKKRLKNNSRVTEEQVEAA